MSTFKCQNGHTFDKDTSAQNVRCPQCIAAIVQARKSNPDAPVLAPLARRVD